MKKITIWITAFVALFIIGGCTPDNTPVATPTPSVTPTAITKEAAQEMIDREIM